MNRPGHVQPYPWQSLASLTHADVAAQRALGVWVERCTPLEEFARALGALLGAEIRIRVIRVHAQASTESLDDAVGLVFGPIDDVPTRRAVVEVERALAVALVARAIGRAVSPAIEVKAPSASVAGAFAALLAAAARRAHSDVPARVYGAGPAQALVGELADLGSGAMAVTARVLVDDEAYAARLVVGKNTLMGACPRPVTRARLAGALGHVRLSLPIVASVACTTAGELASLRLGDVWLPGGWFLSRGLSESGDLQGNVVLAAPGAETGLRAEFAAAGALVLRGEVEALVSAEGAMDEQTDKDALFEAVGEIPVVVRVEIGEASMLAREWAALVRGDVIALGQRVGERVQLRVGGVVVAKGDLVSIDGDVGVRIAERTTSDTEKAP